MKKLLGNHGYNTNDFGDLFDFVQAMFNLFLWIVSIVITVSVILVLFDNGHAPPEPQFWIDFRAALFARLSE